MKYYTLVTGATGNTGREVVKGLVEKNEPFKAATSNPVKTTDRLFAHAELIKFDFKDPATYEPALERVTRVFLVRPPALANVKQDFGPFIRAMKKARVEQVVFLSLLGAEKNPITPHHKIEKLIRDHKLPYTFLRPGFFMQNLDTIHRQEIKEDREIFIPAGKGKTSFIDVRDIAKAAVKVLTEPGHINQAYSLTGNEALTYYQVAEIFSLVMNREITYKEPSYLRFFLHMKKRGFNWTHILVMLALYTLTLTGKAGKITGDYTKLTGGKPGSVRQYAEDYKQKFI